MTVETSARPEPPITVESALRPPMMVETSARPERPMTVESALRPDRPAAVGDPVPPQGPGAPAGAAADLVVDSPGTSTVSHLTAKTL